MKNVFSRLHAPRVESASQATDGPAAAGPKTKPITASPSFDVTAAAKKPRLPPELIREVALHYVDNVKTEAGTRALFASRYVSHVWKNAVDTAPGGGFLSRLSRVAANDALAGLVVSPPVNERRAFPYFKAPKRTIPPSPEQHVESYLIKKHGPIERWQHTLAKADRLEFSFSPCSRSEKERMAAWAITIDSERSEQQIARILNVTNALQSLTLSDLASLKFLHEASLPSTLRELFLEKCGAARPSITSIQWTNFPQLRTLSLYDCGIGLFGPNWSLHVADMHLEELYLENNWFLIEKDDFAREGVILPQLPLEQLPALKILSLAGSKPHPYLPEQTRHQLQLRTKAALKLTHADSPY